MRQAYTLALLSLALTACEAPTELMLVVKAAPGLSYGPGNDVDTLHVQVQPADDAPMEFFFTRLVELCPPEAGGTINCRPQQYVDDTYTGALTLPVRLLFIPGDHGSDKEIRIWVDALKAGYQDPRLSNGMRFRFSHGQRLWLELPLYHQCLDNLKCEMSDQVCNKNQDCEVLLPTDSEPPLDPTELPDAGIDLSVPEPVDMSELPDLAQICGDLNQACCDPSGSCNSGLLCNASKFCTDSSCGQLGNPCCTSGMQCLTAGATCNGAMVCVPPCGALDQACCSSAGMSCLQGQCFTNYADMGQSLCEACGKASQRCCPGDVCASGNNCMSGTCQPCGTLGMPACRSGTACQAMLVPDSAGLCNPCGGAPGSGCCPGPKCNALGTLTCDTNDAPYTNPTSNVCIACGGLGGWCCSDPLETNPCQNGLVCNGMKRCIAPNADGGTPPCGASGQACCAGNTCNSGLACQGATCVPCGAPGQPCCPTADMGCTCNQSLQLHIESTPPPPGSICPP